MTEGEKKGDRRGEGVCLSSIALFVVALYFLHSKRDGCMYIQLDDEEEKRRDEGYKKVQMRGEQTCSTGVEGGHVPGGSTTASRSSLRRTRFNL